MIDRFHISGRRRGAARRSAGAIRLLAGMALALAVCILIAALFAEYKISRLVLGGLGESFSTRIYGAPAIVDANSYSSPRQLIERLERLKYRKVVSGVAAPGEYSWIPPTLTICLRGFQSPSVSQQPKTVSLIARNDNQWTIADSTGLPVDRIILEPENLTEISGPQKIRRDPATFDQLPPRLINAVTVAEDKRFFSHWGIDWLAILRAAYLNITHPNRLHGGSTITQQLVKNLFLSPQRTFRRKIIEALLSAYLELRFSKKKILTLYLNQIYMGQDGPESVAGVKAAAQFYFGKELPALSLAECATLAAIIRSPFLYNPARDPVQSKARRDLILRHMFIQGLISKSEMETAVITPVKARAITPETQNDNAYAVAEIIRQLVPRYSEDELFRLGMSVYSTIDPLAQKIAQKSVQRASRQAALVAIDPRSGSVRALVGGKDFRESQFNRATQGMRQPGSAFKPFVYGAALEKGFTSATLLIDRPHRYRGGPKKSWRPSNYDGVYRGTTTFRTALALSLNAATIDLAHRLGTEPILDFARKCGIESNLDHSLAVALGDSDVNLLELTSAYAPFVNGGFSIQPHLIESVTDADGTVLEAQPPDRLPAIDPAIASLMTSLLQSTITEGTAKALPKFGWTRPAAGKTGTTNAGKDAWFIGYTPQLLAGVWVGDDQAKALNLAGAKDALPIWAAFMNAVLGDFPPTPFPEPQGLVSATIDPQTGLLAKTGCPKRLKELFLPGTEPVRYCEVHSGGIIGLFQRIFSN